MYLMLNLTFQYSYGLAQEVIESSHDPLEQVHWTNLVQLNEYETTDLYFLQNFQSNTSICLIIHLFCKSCEPEIVLPVLQIKTETISRL